MRQFIIMGEQFCHHLTMHHTIEEMHIFPVSRTDSMVHDCSSLTLLDQVLAVKMPAFQKELQLLTQHKQIHLGLEKFEDYLAKCKSGESDLRMDEMKGLMDSFGDVLWTHLDDEVKELGAENMRKYWTPEEMRRMPM